MLFDLTSHQPPPRGQSQPYPPLSSGNNYTYPPNMPEYQPFSRVLSCSQSYPPSNNGNNSTYQPNMPEYPLFTPIVSSETGFQTQPQISNRPPLSAVQNLSPSQVDPAHLNSAANHESNVNVIIININIIFVLKNLTKKIKFF